MLDELKEASTMPLNPQRVLRVFEKGAMNAFKEEFHGVIIIGCNFHMNQAIWRKLKELGLAREYKENKYLRDW